MTNEEREEPKRRVDAYLAFRTEFGQTTKGRQIVDAFEGRYLAATKAAREKEADFQLRSAA